MGNGQGQPGEEVASDLTCNCNLPGDSKCWQTNAGLRRCEW
jgi:hypothetical protein